MNDEIASLAKNPLINKLKLSEFTKIDFLESINVQMRV